MSPPNEIKGAGNGANWSMMKACVFRCFATGMNDILSDPHHQAACRSIRTHKDVFEAFLKPAYSPWRGRPQR